MVAKLLLGCDPELVLRNKHGRFVSAEGVVPGDKLNPHKVKKGTVQVDGFAAEIGIVPARTPEEFADNVETVLDELRRFTVGYELVYPLDHVIFDDEEYLRVSDKGRELGCDPDMSAYTRLPNPSPIPNPRGLRTFSGHIHVGWTEDEDVMNVGHQMDCFSVVKQLDLFVGAPTVAWNPGMVRRSLYGGAGALRVKPYGVEYRTPDNGWLASRDRMLLVAENTIAAMNQLYAGKHLYNGIDRTIQAAINQGDYQMLQKYLQKHGIRHDKQDKKPAKLTGKTGTVMQIA